MTDQIRVLTLNVQSPDNGGWAERSAVIRKELAALRADVVALQEVVQTEQVNGAAELVGPGHHVLPHPWRAANGVTAALASRWPFGRVHPVDLVVNDRAAEFTWGGAVIAEILAPPPLGPFLFAHHKPCYQLPYEHERELQAVRTAHAVEEMLDGALRPVVLAGDMDATPDSGSIRFWTGRQSLAGTSVGYHDAWESVHSAQPGFTFTASNPLVRAGDMALMRDRRIDYIMVRGDSRGPSLEARHCELACHLPEDGVQPSDHYGVVADLALPG